jgi:hypothetical protein
VKEGVQIEEGNSNLLSYGVLLNGTNLVFKGLVDIDFTHFLGMKHDQETDSYTFGRFNSQLEIENAGTKNYGYDEYIGNFSNGYLEGIGIWL